MHMKEEAAEAARLALPSCDKLPRVFIAEFVKRIQHLVLLAPNSCCLMLVLSEGFRDGNLQVQEGTQLGFGIWLSFP